MCFLPGGEGDAALRLGIKRKLLLVLVGSLALTTALHVLVTAYFTDRQNEDAAFALLQRDLLAWQNELQDLTLQLRTAAVAATGDRVVLNQLAELVALQYELEDPGQTEEAHEAARTAAYLKSVSINRFHLVRRTGRFSSVTVYVDGRLSHHVSAQGAGMMIDREGVRDFWVAAPADARGNLPTEAWPAWEPTERPGFQAPIVSQPTISFEFSGQEAPVIQVAVPVQGVIDDVLTDQDERPKTRFVSDLSVAGEPSSPKSTAPNPPPAVLAVVVFRKLLGPGELEKVATRTGKLPALYSPGGDNPLHLEQGGLPPAEVLRAGFGAGHALPQPWQGIVTSEQGSYYAAVQPWAFEGQPAFILSLAASRETTQQNIRQTIAASLAAAGLILLLSLVAGTLLMGRLINPVVALTAAVHAIGMRGGAQAGTPARQGLEWLRQVDIDARDEVGELTRAFNVMIGELRTTLETLEQRVQAGTAELRQQSRYLRTLIDTLPLVAWLKDTEGRYLAVNEANARTCGRSVEEMVGKTDVELWPRELALAYRADDAEIMSTRKLKTIEELLSGPGGTIWIETYKAPVIDEDGTVLGTAGAARDISERKAAEAAREAALREAERLARLRSDFLAQMSHELRTPLNGILGYAQIMRRDRTLNEKQIERVNVIQQSGEHLLTLINDVLDLAKLEAGKVELYPTGFDLCQFLLVIAEIVRVKAEEKQLGFTCDLAPDLPARVHADEKRLRQILLNLLSNAVKFTDAGQVSLRVRSLPPGGLRFEIEDTGAGIPEEQIETIFQPFEQAGDSRQRLAGAGLGLAISRQFVRLMGGDIRVKSRIGEGSLFYFDLEMPVLQAAMPASRPESVVTGYLGPRKAILVVDDLMENRRLVADMLEPLGFELLEAESGEEALERVSARRPDLVLMDVVMPGMNGLETIRRLRGMTALADLPVIALSASASGSDERKGLAAGASAFLPKPLDLARLLAYLDALLKLQWTYEIAPATACAEEESDVPLEPPPAAELRILHELALQGSMREIAHEADRVAALDPRYRPFARRLRQLAESYQSKAVLRLVEHYLEQSPAPPA